MYYGNYGYNCKTVRRVIHMQIFLLYFRFVHAYFENLVQLVQGIFNEWNKKTISASYKVFCIFRIGNNNVVQECQIIYLIRSRLTFGVMKNIMFAHSFVPCESNQFGRCILSWVTVGAEEQLLGWTICYDSLIPWLSFQRQMATGWVVWVHGCKT